MSELLPKWAMRSYVILRRNFKDKEFSSTDVQKIIKKSNMMIGVILITLRKAGWIDAVGLDPKDLRKIFYKVIPIEKILEDIEL